MECWQKRTVLEKKSLVTLIVILVVLIGLITLILLVTEPDLCHTPSCTESYKHMTDLIDPSENPCHNFYNFACGKASRNRNGDTESIKLLKKIISEPIDVRDTRSLKLQKQFYRSCGDLRAIDADNDATFWKLITNLGGWPVVSGNNWNESAFDFAEFMVELRERGLQHDWFLDISVYSNRGSNIILEINVPDNANKIEEEIADEYVNLMVNTAVAFGAHENVAKSQMPEVMYFENKLTNLIDEIFNENKMMYRQQPLQLITIAEVQQKWQNINWLELLNHLTRRKLTDDQLVAFYVRNYMAKLDTLLRQTTKRTQVNYVVWKLVETYSPYLSRRIRDLEDNYSTSTNQKDLWYKDREDFCFEEARSFFQYTLETAYLRRHVTEEKLKDVEDMIRRILEQMSRHIRRAKWMEEITKTIAISKLENISYIIGGPEEMYYTEQFDRDFGTGNVEFNSTNIIDINVAIFDKRLDTLYSRKYEDANFLKYTFYDSVATEEVEFVQNYNLLCIARIPAGSLHGFLYDLDRPKYLNYGTLGTTIARELTTGLYSALFRNFIIWSNGSLTNFDKTVECLKNCSDGREEVNCEEAVLENIAGHVSINLSYQAYQQLSKEKPREKHLSDVNFSNNQLFWLAYASSMCHLPVPESNYSRIDHMMHAFRIVGPYRNSPHFSEDFKCEIGSNMNPRIKCQIP